MHQTRAHRMQAVVGALKLEEEVLVAERGAEVSRVSRRGGLDSVTL